MKKFKKILALALCLLMVLGAAVACDSSDETDESTTEAATTAAKETETEAETEPEEDKKDDDKENEGDEPASDAIGISSLAEMTEKRGNYYLTANIGTADAPNETHLETFAGTLDGKGFTVFTKVPLFDELADGAKIKNLTIDGAISVKGTMAGAVTPNAKGAVTLEKVINKAPITVEQTNKCLIGGLVGLMGLGGTMTDCENNATVTVNPPEGEVGFEMRIGGLVGSAEGGADTKFIGCKNTGNVISNSTNGTTLMGGLVGDAKAAAETLFENCSNSGTFTNMTNANGCKIGGIVALASNASGTYKFVNCKNTANITSNAFVAGIAADIRGLVEMTGCVNTGDLTATTTGTVTNLNKYAAGIFGQIYNTPDGTNVISKCANYGKIVADTTTGDCAASGIAAISNKPVALNDCVNYGAVEAGKVAGGIFGRVNTDVVTLTRCLNVGDVTATTSAGSMIGNMTKSHNDTTKFITLTDCYSVDTVTYGVATNAGAADTKGNVKYIYGGEEKGTVMGGTDTAGGATAAYSALFTTHGAKATDALKGDAAKTTLAGFDFTNTWKATANGYPELA